MLFILSILNFIILQYSDFQSDAIRKIVLGNSYGDKTSLELISKFTDSQAMGRYTCKFAKKVFNCNGNDVAKRCRVILGIIKIFILSLIEIPDGISYRLNALAFG